MSYNFLVEHFFRGWFCGFAGSFFMAGPLPEMSSSQRVRSVVSACFLCCPAESVAMLTS